MSDVHSGSVEGRVGRSVPAEVTALDGERRSTKQDEVVGEEPLEIRLTSDGRAQTLAVTMRTPGNDFELVAGFLYGEGIVRSRREFTEITYCLDPAVDPQQRYNIVTTELATAAPVDASRFERHFVTSSACGVCGRAQLDSLRELGVAPLDDDFAIWPSVLYQLPQRMRESQRVFAATGGLHAAALFDECGAAVAVREDVGRHNAVDKLVGWGLLNGRLPFERSILIVSGRAGYEILQKSAMARIPVVCSVSAPSSLAVELAREFNVTLVGFLRGERANVYSGTDRILASSPLP
ncbi:MAG: formate dehydrogenase accessory sulfurtransferase FdhD [Candidatus Eremiobacteraeota bacterium]|nr:formate dehydrogenase accessory sulfurtransferase FdhD [Candidatus Eremiobacteraeota bacterium]MBV9055285.1 formate dehydrogenase accessory sulfurtransferase FdhD [Candidatus Eremiobacteraeota bacterium]MBV9698959.1 formate dehydrogenase accessory sulfurtransferase FdhD [Candidatus Eremiobacteraeota bacterium]